jgi:hypothetical protein
VKVILHLKVVLESIIPLVFLIVGFFYFVFAKDKLISSTSSPLTQKWLSTGTAFSGSTTRLGPRRIEGRCGW